MGVKFHGIELVGDSHIKNTKLETLTSDPSLSIGKVWYDSVNNVYKGFDNSVARLFKNNVDIENILYQRKDKESVRVATTGTISISTCPTEIDGVTLATSDRVLVKDANLATDNGIFVVGTIGTYAALTRSLDADNSPEGEVMQGMHVWVSDGVVNGGSAWLLETSNPITLGTTSLSFKYFSTSGTPITAGTGILDNAGSLSVKRDGTTITSSVNGIKVQDGLVYQDFLAFEDTPSTYGTTGQILVVNETGNGFTFIDKINSILDNTDTPSSFGNVGDTLVVNATQNGFIWANPFTDIQTELNMTQSSAGLNADGTYSAPGTSNYLSGTTDLVDCAVAIDGKLATLLATYNAEFYSVQTSTAALTHTITHSLNTAFPEVTVWAYDSGTSTWNIDVQDVVITDNNTIDITLAASENVRVVVRKGSALTI